jgi:hypothetical protein
MKRQGRSPAKATARKYAPAILDELADLQYWLLNSADREDLLILLPNDVVAAMTAFRILDARKQGLTADGLVSQLRSQIENGDAPVLYRTYDLLKKAIWNLKSASDIESDLSIRRSNVFEMKDRLQNELYEPDDEIGGWVRYKVDDDSEILERCI